MSLPQPRVDPYVAVEIDVLDGSGAPLTLRLCNRGTVTRIVTTNPTSVTTFLDAPPADIFDNTPVGTVVTNFTAGNVNGSPFTGTVAFATGGNPGGQFAIVGPSSGPGPYSLVLATPISAGQVASVQSVTIVATQFEGGTDTGYTYDPRLTGLPIQLGMSINVTNYGQPIRAQPNGGTIKFILDESIWAWFDNSADPGTSFHWIGRIFRVYEGDAGSTGTSDVDADMVLVASGCVAGITHDTITATIQTTDTSLLLDNPLVTDFYDDTFPLAIQGKPKPYLWGFAFSVQPQIENETTQVYRFSARPVASAGDEPACTAVRVGGVAWAQASAGIPPIQGQWADNGDGTITLGSPPLGYDVRCDCNQGSYTLAQIITMIVNAAGVEGVGVDFDAMATLDTDVTAVQSYWTSITPVNRLQAFDDLTLSAGCWWGVNALGDVTAAAIKAPDDTAQIVIAGGPYIGPMVGLGTPAADENVMTLALNIIQPLAWRLRVGYQRSWQPETNFAPAVLQTTQALLSEPAVVFEPHYENDAALVTEPRAVDVPMLLGTGPAVTGAENTQTRLSEAWGENRMVFDCTAQIRPETLILYQTALVQYMMVTGAFRLTSAIRSIGGGPATIQLWGVIGDLPALPPD